MGDSSIEWTDKTWNPTRGCRRISPGCEHCYAETMAARFCGEGQPFEGLIQLGKQGPRWNGAGRFVPDKLDEPLRWRKPARVFVNSMSDLFFEKFSNDEIAAVFGVMAACPQHTFQVLTKRLERVLEWFKWAAKYEPDLGGAGPLRAIWDAVCQSAGSFPDAWDLDGPPVGYVWPLPNVHIGVSVENQHYADERLPLLLQLPAAVRFVSYEPALGPVNFHPWLCQYGNPAKPEQRYASICEPRKPGIDWLIVGGESGTAARPFDLAWARTAVQQSKAAGVPVFVKQLGSRPIVHHASEWPGARFDVAEQHVKLLDRKGGDMSEWPEELRVREFPEVRRG